MNKFYIAQNNYDSVPVVGPFCSMEAVQKYCNEEVDYDFFNSVDEQFKAFSIDAEGRICYEDTIGIDEEE